MKIISHRGNLTGANPATENDPAHIQHVLYTTKFDVELDVWLLGNEWYLGHDEPKYTTDVEWLLKRNERLWLHAKNKTALEQLSDKNYCDTFNAFWHENDKYTLTTLGWIWVYPEQTPTKSGVIVHLGPDFKQKDLVYGICTDYPLSYVS